MKMPCLNNKVYDWLKWIALGCVPTISWIYAQLARVWGWEYASQISETADLLGMALACLIGASTISYSINSKSHTITNNMTGDSETSESLSSEDSYSDGAPDGGD